MNSASASDKLWSLICHYECELKEKKNYKWICSASWENWSLL